MAALADNVAVIYAPEMPVVKRIYKTAGADEFYRGALVYATSGKAQVVPADASLSIGVNEQRLSATAADQALEVFCRGIFWFAAAQMTDANLGVPLGATASSDNPADLVVQTTSGPSTMGVVMHVDVTGTSGWLDINQRAAQTNA